MFFFGPKVLLLLKRHSLEIYFKNSDRVMEVVFHSSAVRHLEVVSRDEVVKTLVEAFKNANLGRQTAVIALSDHIIFERLIPQSDGTHAQEEIQGFYHDVPLEEAHIAKKIMVLKGSSLALAANRELYQVVVEVAQEFEWKVKAVIPMTPFSKLAEDEQLTPQQVGQILGAEDIIKEADFLKESFLAPEIKAKVEGGTDESKEAKESEVGDDEGDPRHRGSKAKTAITIFLILFLFSFILGSLIYFKIINLPFSVPFLGESLAPVASMVPEASQSAQTAPAESTASANTQEASVSGEINKGDIRIHVLNGSGISGQAAVIKEKLADIGYENVITGNVESAEASASSIVYSEGLEVPVKQEIDQLMDLLIKEVTKTDEAISEFNAVITLGKLEEPIE